MKYKKDLSKTCYLIIAVILIMAVVYETIFIIKNKYIANDSNEITTANLQSAITKNTDTPTLIYVDKDSIDAEGSIIFKSAIQGQNQSYGFFLMNENGRILRNLGTYTGSSAWSPNGSLLAVGCKDINQICILDMSRIGTYQNFPINWPKYSGTWESEVISLPKECSEIILEDRGVTSLSWSRDGNKLAVVCKNYNKKEPVTKVCIIPISGVSECWSNNNSEFVQSASFSPIEDLLVISRQGKIEITNYNGDTIKDLTDGYNPVWSPDGNKIAYSSYSENGNRSGIAMIDKEGKNIEWLYEQPKKGEYEEYLCTICNVDHRGISWSPDGKYLVFSATYLGDYTEFIFKLEVTSRQITILVNPFDFLSYSYDPNWGPFEFK